MPITKAIVSKSTFAVEMKNNSGMMSLYLNHCSVEEIEVLDKLVLIDKDGEIAE